MSERICKHCGETLTQRPGENSWKFGGRNFCNAKCRADHASGVRHERAAALLAIAEAEHPPCEECKNPVRRRPNEGLASYVEKRFCSHICGNRNTIKLRAARAADAPPKLPEPVASPLVGEPFAAHDRDPGDTYGRIPTRPATHVETASNIARAI